MARTKRANDADAIARAPLDSSYAYEYRAAYDREYARSFNHAKAHAVACAITRTIAASAVVVTVEPDHSTARE